MPQVTIDETTAGLRLDKALSQLEEVQSRSLATKLIQNGSVLVNGKVGKASYSVKENDIIEYEIPKVESVSLEPYDFPLDILFEDSDIIVVNKPSGLVVHPSAGHFNDTLVNALLFHCKNLSMGFGENRPGIVHRLDKDTSGILVVAKNNHSQEHLAKQFKEKSVHRIYHALAFGKLKSESLTVESYLTRHPTDRKRFASEKLKDGKDPRGKLAITHFKQIHEFTQGLQMVECRLETGRTHQIRIHLTEQNCAIVGDTLYGSTSRTKNLKSLKLRSLINKLDRIGLHARELGFVHPTKNEKMYFKATWPNNMKPLLEELNYCDQS